MEQTDQMDGRTNRQMDGQTDGPMDKQMDRKSALEVGAPAKNLENLEIWKTGTLAFFEEKRLTNWER